MTDYDDTLTDPADCEMCLAHDRVRPCPECAREIADEQADWREDR